MAKAQKEWEDEKAVQLKRKAECIPRLPRIVQRKADFSEKDICRYISQLVAPLGKAGADIKLNTKAFAEEASRYMSIYFSVDMVSEKLMSLDKLDMEGRLLWVIDFKKIMKEAAEKKREVQGQLQFFLVEALVRLRGGI